VFVTVLAFAALFGLAIGSFLNVVIWRVPRGESIVRPSSHCPACSHPVRPRDDIPVLSWLLLRRRCRDCRAPISARYPAIEALTALLFVGIAVRFYDMPWALPAFFYFGAIAVALTFIDLDTRRLPNAITLPSYVVGLALLSLAAVGAGGPRSVVRSLVGLAVYYAIYWVLWFAVRGRGIGYGDVKLAGVLGLYLAFLGWGTFGVGLIAPTLLGGMLAFVLLLTGRATRKTAVPYGPMLTIGALLAILWGEPISRAWLEVSRLWLA
jgi:leader peptidase (prepilin peptidase)/N-methyltransferase